MLNLLSNQFEIDSYREWLSKKNTVFLKHLVQTFKRDLNRPLGERRYVNHALRQQLVQEALDVRQTGYLN